MSIQIWFTTIVFLRREGEGVDLSELEQLLIEIS